MCWKTVNLEARIKSGSRIQIENPSDWFVFCEIFVQGEYDDAIKLAFQNAENNSTLNILDIGANTGFFTLRVLDLLDSQSEKEISVELTAIEGSPVIFEQLKKRTGNLKNGKMSIKPVLGLVGERTGTGRISYSEFAAMTSTKRMTNGESTVVPFVDVEDLIESEARIDLLKCDIEGSEETFISNYGSLLSRTSVAIFELHHRLCDTKLCIALLEKAGLKPKVSIPTAGDTSTILFLRDMN